MYKVHYEINCSWGTVVDVMEVEADDEELAKAYTAYILHQEYGDDDTAELTVCRISD